MGFNLILQSSDDLMAELCIGVSQKKIRKFQSLNCNRQTVMEGMSAGLFKILTFHYI